MKRERREDSLSVLISLVLRHKPDAAGITLDEHGWADVAELMEGIRKTGRPIDMDLLEVIVRTDEKGRYSFNGDRTLIRANQGHSIPVDVELSEAVPPEFLYHGTAERFKTMIQEEGLRPMSRLYVHLSGDMETAVKVGRRHGKPVVFEAASGQMHRDGIRFYLSQNGVWLTKYVKPQYVKIREHL